MQWYWWVMIGIGIAGIGALKLYFFGKLKKKAEAKKIKHNDED